MMQMIEWLRWLVRLIFGLPTVEAVTQRLWKNSKDLEEIYNLNIGMSEALEITISKLVKECTEYQSIAASANELRAKVDNIVE